jgi:HK97 family phage portal protein
MRLPNPFKRARKSSDTTGFDIYKPWEFIWGIMGQTSKAGPIVSPDTAMRQATVYACVNLLSRMMGIVPFHVFQKALGSKRRIQALRHPLTFLLSRSPNTRQTPFEFFQFMMICLLLRGNFYALINRDRDTGDILSMVPIMPDKVDVRITETGSLIYRVYGATALGYPDGGFTEYGSDKLWHVRGLSMDSVKGLSVINYHKETIGLGIALVDHGSAFFKNGARPSGVLEHPQAMSDPAYQRLLKYWEETYASAENAGKTAVLEEGMKYNPLTMSAEDAQYVDTGKMTRSQICSIFGVQPHKVGDLERATFSNIEHQAIEFVTDAMLPWVRCIEQSANKYLLGAEQMDMYVEGSLEILLRGDIVSRYKAYAISRQWGWASANDIREKENEEPIEEGGDVYLQPINMTDAANPVTPQNSSDSNGNTEDPSADQHPDDKPPKD